MQIKAIHHWQNWVDLALGVALFISPWVLGYVTTGAADAAAPTGFTRAAWNAWLTGVVVAGLVVITLIRFDEWVDWVTGLVGAWVIAAPWILGFADIPAAMASHVVLGVLIVAFAAWDLWGTRQPTPGARSK